MTSLGSQVVALCGWGRPLLGNRSATDRLSRRPAPCIAPANRGRQLRVDLQARNRQRRLLSYVLSAPQRADRYFEASLVRRWMWAGVSLCSGFYAGNIATLSFGALAVNDLLAAVITLMFCEVVTHLYYTNKSSRVLWFANCFKMGLIASLLADALKLGS